MLTWPQSGGNPIFEDLNFKDFTGQNALRPPKGDHLPQSISQSGKPFSKILYLPQLYQGTTCNCNVCIE